ncbi:MAG: lysozyme inhibitor LprI family protein [Rhizobiaceae bacterium]
MRNLLFAVLLIAPISNASAQQIDCAKRKMIAANTVLYCADKDFEAADHELNQIWRSVNTLTRTQKEYSKAILHSQRAWLKFRDAQCNAETFSSEVFRKPNLQYILCKTRKTLSRTIELKWFVGDF